jgi:hypothetical protein
VVSKTGCLRYRSRIGLGGLLRLLKPSQLGLVTYEELDCFVSKRWVLANHHLKAPDANPPIPVMAEFAHPLGLFSHA